MNERIQELMVELKKTVSTHRGDAVLIGYDEIEKFAELIVRECIQVSEPVLNEPYEDMTEFGKGLVEGQDVAIEKIKEHFGVEE